MGQNERWLFRKRKYRTDAAVWHHFDWRAAQTAAAARQAAGLSGDFVHEHLHKLAASPLHHCSPFTSDLQNISERRLLEELQNNKDLAEVRFDGMSLDISSVHSDVCGQKKSHQHKSGVFPPCGATEKMCTRCNERPSFCSH